MVKKISSLFFICLIFFMRSNGVNVVIIESTSGGHTMDANWQSVCTGLGYTNNIYPQTQLDVNTWFATTDFLIVSDGTIALPQSRVATIQAYLAQGGRVFLQTEYLSSFDTNGAFQQMVNALGGSFNWVGTSSGTLNPMNVSGSLSTTPNVITPLNYFWYGCSGTTGCNSHIEPFQKWNGLNFGFIFCVPGSSMARMITSSDQDWVQQNTSIPLMQNIAVNLANPNYSCAAVGSGGLSVNLGNDTTICNGGSLFLNAATAGATSYLWNNGSTFSSYTVSASNPAYWVQVSNGTCTSTDTISVIFGNIGTVNLGNDTSVCTGAVIALNGTTAGAISYLWSTGETTATISVSAAGTYWVSVSNGTCTAVDSMQANFGNTGLLNLGNDTLVCSGDSVILNATTTGATYQWQNNSTSSTLTVTQTGTYSVTALVSGCTLSDAIQVDVATPVVVSVNSGTPSICAGDSAQVCAPSGFVNYLWNNGGTSLCIKTGVAGNFYVTVTDNNGCVAKSDTATVMVNQPPVVTVSANQTIFCSGDSAQVCAAVSSVTYLWNTGQTSNCIYANHAGNYYVTVTDANNCTAVSNHLPVFVYPLPPVSVSVNGDTLHAFNAVTYQWYFNNNSINGATDSVYIATQTGNYTVEISDTNGCHVTSNAVNVIVSGLKEIGEGLGVRIFPNPSNYGTWQLEVANDWLNGKVEIVDATGRLVFQSSIFNLQSSISLDVARGVYLLRIFNNEKNATVKLVKW